MTKNLVELAVQRGAFPRFVFKYRDLGDRTIRSIKEGKFWFANSKSFNDPFDCNLSETHNINFRDYRAYMESLGTPPELISEATRRARKDKGFARNLAIDARKLGLEKYGIFSLSRIKDNILMWSHYADSHSGIVFEFDMLADPDFFHIPMNVKYQGSYKELSYYSDRKGSIEKNLSTKSDLWRYEEEIRIVKEPVGLHPIRRDAIRSVYFGCKVTQRKISEVRNIFLDANYMKIRYFRATVNHGDFSLSFHKI